MPNYLNMLTDPEVFSVLELPPRSDHVTDPLCPTAARRISLRGEWRLLFRDTFAAALACFPGTGTGTAEFSHTVTVPGHIQLSGFGTPQYTNIAYPWDGREDVPIGALPEHNPTALYTRSFSLTPNEALRRVRVRFEGAESCLFLFINGSFAGYAENSFCPAEFDITPYIRAGENEITAAVAQFCTGSWLEDQDFWRLSGLFREVTLLILPDVYFEDLHVQQEVEESLTSAHVFPQIRISAVRAVQARLTALLDGKPVLESEVQLAPGENTVEFRFDVSSPKLWSAETPTLYRFSVLLTAGGETLDLAETDIGFRRFVLQNGVMHLNGKRIVFHGINRHEFHRDRGRALTEEDIERDLRLIKQSNFNAVRTSHYPNQSCFYRLCDRLGLYVIDETNLETHGTWGYGSAPDLDAILPDDKPQWRDAVLSRGRAMLERDKNHPCILLWSCGNESCGGKTLRDLAAFFRSRDNTRLVHYEGIRVDPRYPDTSDVISCMYMQPAAVRKLLEEGVDKPFLLCEYAHAMGTSFGNVAEYTALEEEFPAYQGGFVWDFADQGLAAFRNDGREYTAAGGDFFDRPNDGCFSGNGLFFADHTPTPKLAEAKKQFEPLRLSCDASGVSIYNKNLFTDTAGYDFYWQLKEDGHPVSCGRFTACAAPQQSVFVPLRWEPDPQARGERVLEVSARLREATLWCEAGQETAFCQSVLSPAKAPALCGAPRLIRGRSHLSAEFPGGSVLLSLARGSIHGLLADGVELTAGDSFIDLWRAPTDNDLANGNAARWASFSAPARYAARCPLALHGDTAEGECTPFPGGSLQLKYRFFADGFSVGCTLRPIPGDLPLFGLGLLLRGSVNRIAFYGDGGHESYPDRCSAERLAFVEERVEDQLVPYLNPQECANRSAVRRLRVTDAEGRGVEITAKAPFSFSALPYTSHELENARRICDLPYSARTVLSLRAAVCGAGGDDSWGAPVHTPYLVRTDGGLRFEFNIRLLPLQPISSKDPGSV